MAYIKLGSLNADGLLAYAELVTKDASGKSPVERGTWRDIASDAAFSTPVPEGGYIDTSLRFRNNYAMMQHIWPALEPVIAARGMNAVLEDAGINGFIGAAFLKQLTGRDSSGFGKVGSRERQIRVPVAFVLDLADITGGRTRNYRNTIYANLLFYSLYRDQDALCREILGAPVGILTNALDRMCQRPEFMQSLGAWMLVSAMFMAGDERGVMHSPKGKDKAWGLNASDALESVSVVLSAQTSRNWDIEDLGARELLALLPRDGQMSYWHKRAAERLGLAQSTKGRAAL